MSHKAFMAKAGALCAAAILIGASVRRSRIPSSETGSFPATLTIDDPGVNDELALPSFAYMAASNYDGTLGPISYTLGWEYAKTITADLGFSVGSEGYTWQKNPAAEGWANIETQLKYVFYQNPEHEFIIAGRAQCGMGQHRQPAEFIAAVRSAYDGHAESLYRQGVRRRSTSTGRGPSR